MTLSAPDPLVRARGKVSKRADSGSSLRVQRDSRCYSKCGHWRGGIGRQVRTCSRRTHSEAKQTIWRLERMDSRSCLASPCRWTCIAEKSLPV